MVTRDLYVYLFIAPSPLPSKSQFANMKSLTISSDLPQWAVLRSLRRIQIPDASVRVLSILCIKQEDSGGGFVSSLPLTVMYVFQWPDCPWKPYDLPLEVCPRSSICRKLHWWWHWLSRRQEAVAVFSINVGLIEPGSREYSRVSSIGMRLYSSFHHSVS